MAWIIAGLTSMCGLQKSLDLDMIGRTLCTGSESVPGRLSTASTPVRGWLHVSLTPASRYRSRVRGLVPVRTPRVSGRILHQVDSIRGGPKAAHHDHNDYHHDSDHPTVRHAAAALTRDLGAPGSSGPPPGAGPPKPLRRSPEPWQGPDPERRAL
jgi:hypothetical protein